MQGRTQVSSGGKGILPEKNKKAIAYCKLNNNIINFNQGRIRKKIHRKTIPHMVIQASAL